MLVVGRRRNEIGHREEGVWRQWGWWGDNMTRAGNEQRTARQERSG